MANSQQSISVAYDATSLARNPHGGISQVTAEILAQASQHASITPIAWYAGGDRNHIEQCGVAARKLRWFSSFTTTPVNITHALRHHSLPVRTDRIVYTVYDVWSLRPNRWQSEAFQNKLGGRMRREIQLADHIVTGSETVRRELLDMQLVAPERVTAILYGVSAPSRAETENIPEEIRAGTRRHFVLYVGYLETRKNIPHVLQAVQALEQVDLVLVGGRGHGIDSIEQDLGRFPAERLHHFHGVSAEALDYLYRHAVALLLPSFEEGFGMPILEAMIRGCPVVTSNRSANAEVGSTAAVLTDPDTPAESSRALEQILEDETFARSLREAGIKQAARFTWADSFERLVQLYRRLLSV